MTPDKLRLIDVRLHNWYRCLADMRENVQIYVGEHTYAVFDGYFLLLSSPKQEKSVHITIISSRKQLDWQEIKIKSKINSTSISSRVSEDISMSHIYLQ